MIKIGKEISQKELSHLNVELNLFKYNKKIFKNIGRYLYLCTKYEAPLFDEDKHNKPK